MLFVVSGPTGSGKDSVINNLVAMHKGAYRVPSTVTRNARPGETGYRYLSHAEFDQRVQNGEFLEYVNVHGTDFYGTLKADLVGAENCDAPVFKVIDVDGYQKLKEAHIKCISIFIDIEDLQELKRRIISRGESEESAEIRLSRVRYECDHKNEFDYIVSAPNLEELTQKCEKIVCSYLK